MSIRDQIAAAAAQRDNYIDPARVNTRTIRTAPAPRPVRSAAPARPAARVRPAGSVHPGVQYLRELAARQPEQDDSGWGIGDAFGLVGGGLMEVLDFVDKGRRGWQSYMGEVGDLVENLPGGDLAQFGANVVGGNPFQLRSLRDENGERDTNFDFGEIRRSTTGEDTMMEGFLGRADWDDDIPGPLRTAVGIAGDLATDPLTYATLGVGGIAKAGASSGVKGIVRNTGRQALPAAREALALRAAREVGADGIENVITRQGAARLERELGQRGQAALTRRGLERAGVTGQQAARVLGAEGTPDFAVRFGLGRAQVRVPGSARVAENIQDLKGVVKKATGSSAAGRLARRMGTTARTGERKARQEILSGGHDAPTAARLLAALGDSKANSWRWYDASIREVEKLGPDNKGMRKLSDGDASAVTHAIESGDFSDPLVSDIAGFLSKKGDELIDGGVTFNKRSNYMPHRLSDEAMKAYQAGDEDVLQSGVFIDGVDVDKTEVFQRMREDDPRTIAEINRDWKAKGHKYNLLEDDARSLVTQYIHEGQSGLMRAGMVGGGARKLGLVDDMGKAVSDSKFKQRIEQLAKGEEKKLKESIATRRRALKRARKGMEESVAAQSRRVGDLSERKVAAENWVAKTQENIAGLQADLKTQQELVQMLQGQVTQAKRVRGANRGVLTKRLREAEGKIPVLQKNLDSATRQFENAQNRLGKWANDLNEAEQMLSQGVKQIDEVRLAQTELEASPVGKRPEEMEEAALKAQERKAASDAEFVQAENEFQVAAKTAQFLEAEVTEVSDKLSQTVNDFNTWAAKVDADPKDATGAARVAERDILAERIAESRKLLDHVEAGAPASRDVAKLEAQALMADMDSTMSRVKAADLMDEYNAGIDLLDNPRFQKMLVDHMNAGWERFERYGRADGQIDSWYREALETKEKINLNPGDFTKAFQKTLKVHRKFMNYWKGFALTSPGFALRNLYSGSFGLYLDDIGQFEMARFGRYHHKVMKDGPEKANEWARKAYGDVGARQLDEAHSVAAASGWGITAAEFSDDPVRRGVAWANPLSSNNPYSYGVRHMSENFEAYMRGGHALGVLRRGGNFDEALGRVQKFHFNYRDISDFDRAMKDVMPFWTFFSRNIALQTSVFAKKPNKITRSYFNAKRNIEDQYGTQDNPMPAYMRRFSPISLGTGTRNLTPDIPSIRFIGQVDELNPLGEGGPTGLGEELISGMSPLPKVGYQLATNRDAFLGREYKNSLERYSDDGYIPRDAPVPFNLPVIKNAVSLLPGAELVDGRLLMQDNTEAALSNVNPMLSRAGRVLPNNQRHQDKRSQFLMGQAGAPIVWNDEGSQAGAIAGDRRAAEAAANAAQEKARLIAMVREGK